MKIEIKEILDTNTIRVTTPDERWYLYPEDKTWKPSDSWVSQYVPAKQLAVWMAKKGFDEAEEYKRLRGDKGSITHHATEELARGIEVNHNDVFPDSEDNQREMNTEEWEAVWSFYRWCEEVKPKFLAHEKTVYCPEADTMGTLDHIVEIDNVKWLIDKKISNYIYLSHEVQISSYFHSEDVNTDKMAILQLGYNKNKKGWKFTEIEDKFDLFLAAKRFWAEENANKQPKQKDYPRSLKLKEK